MERRANHFIWVSAEDCDPPHGLDMSWKHDAEKVAALTEAFKTNGFDKNMPALIGYPNEGRIQLLSGTHRHLAAKQAGIKLPVVIVLRSIVEASWGTDKWNDLIEDIPVNKLENSIVENPVPPPGLDERVDLSKDIQYDEPDPWMNASLTDEEKKLFSEPDRDDFEDW
jgi:hypothetical protein